MKFDPLRGLLIALEYERLPVLQHRASLPFNVMAWDELSQFKALSKVIRFERWHLPGQPYSGSAAMRQDVLQRRHLYVFAGGNPHPCRDEDTTFRGRSVHDVMGHAVPGNDFSPDGELNAFIAHARVYSPIALPALASDNLGQTAYYYFHPRNVGKPHSERVWPQQKMALLSEGLWGDLLP